MAVNYIPSYGSYPLDGFEVDPYYSVSANYGYDFPAGLLPLLDNTRVTVGIDNALGKEPPSTGAALATTNPSSVVRRVASSS